MVRAEVAAGMITASAAERNFHASTPTSIGRGCGGSLAHRHSTQGSGKKS